MLCGKSLQSVLSHVSRSNLTLGTLSRGRSDGLIRLWFRAKLIQVIGNLEPRGFEIHEDVALRPYAWIVIKGSGWDPNDVLTHRRDRRATYRAECMLVPWRGTVHWCLVGPDQRLPADPFGILPL